MLAYKKSFLLFAFVVLVSIVHAQTKLISYVRPLTGTARMGHVFPGATLPFGAVQLSPDTDTIPYEMNGKYNPDVYKYCAGYQYSDKTIVGFSHTHFSGTGHSDLGDFLLMPTTGELQLNPGTADHPETGYRSVFSHENEIATPAYYKVKLDDQNITAELTATTRVGMHRYRFPAGGPAHIIFDAMHGIYNYDDKNVWTFIRVEKDGSITGFRQTNGWARTRTVYFAMRFSKPIKEYGFRKYDPVQAYHGFWGKFKQDKNFPEMAGHRIRAWFDFDVAANETVEVKLALSPVSTEGALLNLNTEIAGWDFDAVKAAGEAAWEKELAKVTIKSSNQATLENFYTAMYHAALMPTVYMDVDGRYKGLDQNIHQANGFTNYSSYSLWDTYRAFHPLLNIIQPQRNADMIQSMLAHYNQSVHQMLPVWSHYANENWCMIGYHSVSVIADAIVKGNTSFDANKALDACVATAMHRNYDGLGEYIDRGYVPEDKSGSSVSKTLEYAYDDWAIAQAALKLNRTDIYEQFMKRSQNFRQVWNPATGFMQARMSDGSFIKDFDPLSTHQKGYIEGNAWNYSLYVPHDPAALISLMGGKKIFLRHLDSLFTMHLPDEFFAHTEDITRDGIIGNYVHGNEPSHHVAYLFTAAGAPYKTQEWVRKILLNQYKSAPDGLGGNDDCGQMSAWYIFNSLGFYPVAPGSSSYAIGSPAIEEASIQLDNGKTFSIVAHNQSPVNVYVKKVLLNGKPISNWQLEHSSILAGGKLEFFMSNRHSN